MVAHQAGAVRGGGARMSRCDDFQFFQLHNRWDVVKIELYAVYEVKLQDAGSID
jgi:hypothetical protein